MGSARAASALLALLALASIPASAAQPEASFQVQVSSPCYVGLPCRVRVNLTSAPPGVAIVGLRLSLPWGLVNLLPLEISPGILETSFTPPRDVQPGVYYALPQLVGREGGTGRLVVFTGTLTVVRLSEPDLIVKIGLQVGDIPLEPGRPARVNVTYLVLNLPQGVTPRLDILVNGSGVYSSPLAESSGEVFTSLVTPSGARALHVMARISIGLHSFENSTIAPISPERPPINVGEAMVLIEAANQSLMQVQLLLGRAASQGIPVFEVGAADLLASADYLLYEARREVDRGNASAAGLAALAFNLTQEALERISEAYVSTARSRLAEINSTLVQLRDLGSSEDLLEAAEGKIREAFNLTEEMAGADPSSLPDLYDRLGELLSEASSALSRAEERRRAMVSRLTALAIALSAALPLFYSYAALRAWRRLLTLG